ncbi:hypothetical protein UFOVP242_137 [uncultured Caudovirales phage]|uniref:Uncharacterized protein n=1 Tax=uncultured Caudovirales phage TaxID=2100421 RepID=A0A6J7X3U0_9CAUD|nr:hypothetical protein UFOVP242_137 [uncultured Caudovirales phage]
MASTYNLAIDQGTDFSANLIIKDSTGTARDLTGYTGNAQLRRSYASTTNVQFTVNIATPSTGVVTLTLANAATANLKYGRYVYDLELTKSSANTIERAYEGIVTVYPEVTR